LCWFAVGVEQAEAEGVGGVCGDGLGAIPDHDVAVGEIVRAAELALAERLGVSGSVFFTERAAGHVGGDGDLRYESFGEAVGVDDVSVERVLAGGHDG
jgi:hypothetical protein